MGDYRNPNHNVWALMVKNGRAGEGIYYKPSTGETIPVRSGTRGSLWRTPGDRSYLVGDRMGPSNGAMRVSETTGKGKNKKTTTVGYKYELLALTDEGEVSTLQVKDDDGNLTQGVWDPEKGAFRTWMRFHPDGGGWGSAGCLVTPGVGASQAFDKMVTPNGTVVTVKYFDTQQQLDDYKKQLEEAYKKKENPSKPSETEQSQPLTNGDKRVKLGTEQKHLAFAQGACMHKGGAPIATGDNGVRTGAAQYPVARETDVCTDNQVIKKTT
jgi:hypothetical protein